MSATKTIHIFAEPTSPGLYNFHFSGGAHGAHSIWDSNSARGFAHLTGYLANDGRETSPRQRIEAIRLALKHAGKYPAEIA